MMDQAARDTMKALETASATTGPTRNRPGPKPGRPRGRRRPPPTTGDACRCAPGYVANPECPRHGRAAAPVSAVAALKHELATAEALAGRLRKALQALEA